jgi:ribosome-binding ATPase YchF (GTP1/OBG family)
MKIGLVGYQGSGKSSLFQWLTGVAPDLGAVRSGQSGMCLIPDPRIDQLCEIYHPKKITHAALEIVDTPGLSRSHEGNAARLALIREAGCLVLVVAAYGGADPAVDLRSFDEDLILADMEIVANRIERIKETFKKPRAKQEREQSEHELAALEGVMAALEASQPLPLSAMTEEQVKATRSFRLLTEKPKLVIVNTADDEAHPDRFRQQGPDGIPMIPVPVGLELELSKMSPADRAEFEQEMGVGGTDRDHLVRTMLDVSGQMTFFTAGEKEVRTWLLHKNGTAVEAAASIHTDLARGFIRAEVIKIEDLLRLRSEREVKAHHLLHQEPKDYVVQENDVILIRFSV